MVGTPASIPATLRSPALWIYYRVGLNALKATSNRATPSRMYCKLKNRERRFIEQGRGGRGGDRHMEGLRRASVTQRAGNAETRGRTHSKGFANRLNLNKSLGQGRGGHRVNQTPHCYWIRGKSTATFRVRPASPKQAYSFLRLRLTGSPEKMLTQNKEVSKLLAIFHCAWSYPIK